MEGRHQDLLARSALYRELAGESDSDFQTARRIETPRS